MEAPNLVLGIDPGPGEHGVVFWNPSACRVQLAANMTTLELQRYILTVSEPGREIIACEFIQSYGMKAGAAIFNTVFEVGRLHAAAPQMRLVYRTQIKFHICGAVHAKDKNVRLALKERFGAKGTKKNPGALYGITEHLWSALAVAIYAAEVCNPEKEYFPAPGLVLFPAGE